MQQPGGDVVNQNENPMIVCQTAAEMKAALDWFQTNHLSLFPPRFRFFHRLVSFNQLRLKCFELPRHSLIDRIGRTELYVCIYLIKFLSIRDAM